MKDLLISVLLLMGSVGLGGSVYCQQPFEKVSFLLRFPFTIDSTNLSIRYFLVGPFGGFGGYIQSQPSVWDYEIPIFRGAKQANSLKAIVYCAGYGMELIKVPWLANRSVEERFVTFTPLPLIHLSGRVVLPENAETPDFNIEFEYLASWSHEFFGIRDGPVEIFNVATAAVGKDGLFTAELPDFTRDPAIQFFKCKGDIRLIARDPKTGNFANGLEMENQPGEETSLGLPGQEINNFAVYVKHHK
ncbi:MAG: hypothetical protein LAO31_22070 [Acidobacteriia bacterium]|nr:hypothetical protein [Terriglobia bacterium]